MAFLPSIEDDIDFTGLCRKWPALSGPIERLSIKLYDATFVSRRTASILFTYTAGLNRCGYCYERHTRNMERTGLEKGVMDALLEDIASAPIEEEMKPLLEVCRKLTLEPSRLTQADVDAVLAAGWSEEAYNVVITICALSNYITRIISAHGIEDAGGVAEFGGE